jgi:hypothetical protein
MKMRRTAPEDLKGPNKVPLPSRNLVLVALGGDESGHLVPFTPLDDLPLHLYQGSVIETLTNRSSGVSITDVAHVFRFLIAPRTDWSSLFDPLHFNLW